MERVTKNSSPLLYFEIVKNIDPNFYVGYIPHNETGTVIIFSELKDGRKFIAYPLWNRAWGIRHIDNSFFEVKSFPSVKKTTKEKIIWML